MVGIAKACQICKNQFITKSARSSSWESYCYECFASRKHTQAVSNQLETHNNKMIVLIKRIEKLEGQLESIPIIISAEISNTLGQLTETDLLKVIKEELLIKIEENQNQREEKLETFQVKIQTQILTLNNKIMDILKEMK